MDFVVDQFKFLGLNNREIKVFTAIGTFGKMNMTTIASRSKLPRTTVDAIVRRLFKQGLISKEKVNGHYEYFVQSTEVADKLDLLEQKLRPKSPSTATRAEECEQVIHDEKIVINTNCIDFLRTAFQKHHGDRVRLMLSHIHREGGKSCVERLQEYVKMAVESHVHFDVLVPPHVADAIHTHPHFLNSPHGLEHIRLNIVPAFYSVLEHDVCMFRDSVVLAHSHKNTFEEIDSITYVDLCNHLLTIASEVGWSVDLVMWLNQN